MNDIPINTDHDTMLKHLRKPTKMNKKRAIALIEELEDVIKTRMILLQGVRGLVKHRIRAQINNRRTQIKWAERYIN